MSSETNEDESLESSIVRMIADDACRAALLKATGLIYEPVVANAAARTESLEQWLEEADRLIVEQMQRLEETKSYLATVRVKLNRALVELLHTSE